MRGGGKRNAVLPADVGKSLIAEFSRGKFQRIAARFGGFWRVDADDGQRYVLLFAKSLDEGLVAVGLFAADAVMDMAGGEGRSGVEFL